MNTFSIPPAYDPNDDSWCNRAEAAIRLHCTERSVPDKAAKGKLVMHPLSERKHKYFVPKDNPYGGRSIPLPIERYRPDNTFVAWITFSDQACNRKGKVEEWSKGLQEVIKRFLEREVWTTIDQGPIPKTEREIPAARQQQNTLYDGYFLPRQQPQNLSSAAANRRKRRK